MKTALFFLISIIICFISFIIIASLNIFQEYLDENYAEHNYILYFVSIFISLVLDLIDFGLETVLEILTHKERQATRTNFFLSFSIKLTVSSSLNSILVPFLCEIIFTKSKRYEVLIGNLFVEFLFNSFATPFLMSFNYCCLLKKLKKYLAIRNLKNKKEYITQKELNNLYEYRYFLKIFLYS